MSKLRDLCLIAASSIATFGIVCLAQEAPEPKLMSSTVVDWTAMPVRKTPVGESRRVFRSPTATLDELECHVTTLNAGAAAHPPHQHPDEEILIIKEGAVESLVNGEYQRVGPGSVIFQASNQLHTIRNVGDTPATYHVLKWNSPGMLKARKAAAQ